MIPANKAFLDWLDDEGNMKKDAPGWARKAHMEWLEHEAEWNKWSKIIIKEMEEKAAKQEGL